VPGLLHDVPLMLATLGGRSSETGSQGIPAKIFGRETGMSHGSLHDQGYGSISEALESELKETDSLESLRVVKSRNILLTIGWSAGKSLRRTTAACAHSSGNIERYTPAEYKVRTRVPKTRR